MAVGPLPAQRLTCAPPFATVREITEREEWNALVLGLGAEDLEQGWEWGELRRADGWTPHRWAAFDSSSCVGAVSILAARIPALGRSILYAPRGPVIPHGDERGWAGLLAAIDEVRRRTTAVFLRVSPAAPHGQESADAALAAHDFVRLHEQWTTWNTPRITLVQDIAGDETALRKALRKSVRHAIADAARRGVTVRPATTVAEVDALYRLLVRMGRAKQYPVRRRRRFRAFWTLYVAAGAGVVLLAEHDGAVVGGLLGAAFGATASFQAMAVDREAGNLGQGALLYWEFVRWARACGCTTVDWGGSGTQYPPRPEDPGFGVYRFKAGFGAQLTYRLSYSDLVFRPALYRLFRLVEQRGLPAAWRVRALLNR